MTNAGGFVTYAATYEPYGAVLEDFGTSSSLGFTGEMHDSTGLVYLRARYADPVTGTFLTRDPVVGQVGGMSIRWNPYTYTGANPVNYIDPDGRFFWFGLAIAAALAIGTIGSAVHEANTQANDKGWDCVDWTKVTSAAAAGFLGTVMGLADLFPPVAAFHLINMLMGTSPEQADRWFFHGIGLGEQYDSLSNNPYFQFGKGVGSLTSTLVGLWQLSGALTSGKFRSFFGGGSGGSGGAAAARTWTQQVMLSGVAVGQLAYGGVTTLGGILQMAGNPLSSGKGVKNTNPRIIGELPPGETRTPEENKLARQYFKNNKEKARQLWEESTGEAWPVDKKGNPLPAEHVRPLKEGGNPLEVQPNYTDPNNPHNVPRAPDWLTDHQRWGAQGTPKRIENQRIKP